MKHVSIVGKSFLIMAVFGVMALGLTFYQSRQMLKVNDSYQALLDRDASAALHLTQSNRSLETARARTRHGAANLPHSLPTCFCRNLSEGHIRDGNSPKA